MSDVAPRPRVASVDLLRGAAMGLMVLDHSRDLVHDLALRFDPVDLSQTDPATFATRWITHIVAPIFVLLAGVGTSLQLQRGASRASVARYLMLRGLLLVLLELTVVRLGIWFSIDPAFAGMLQIIWVLGVSMIALAVLLFLPVSLVALLAVALIAGHNAFDLWSPPRGWEWLWSILHRGGALPVLGSPEPNLLVLYPLLPWPGVIALGYVVASAYRWDASRRRRVFLALGLALTAGWLALRFVNLYGDPSPWEAYDDPATTVMSFLNAEKYPPSLVFLLMTVGPTMLLLGWLDGSRPGRIGGWLAAIGAAPLVFYLLQWFVVHGLAVVVGLVAGQDVGYQFLAPPGHFIAAPPDAGFPLPVVYLVWVASLVLLAPVVRWYAGVRARRGGVLRYL